jgi:hypothetical protein
MIKSREAFEKFAREHQNNIFPDFSRCDSNNDDYWGNATQKAWQAWQHQQSRIDSLEQENAALRAKVSAARAEALDDAANVCSDKEEQFNEPADDYEIGYKEAAQDIYGKIIALKDETK